MRLRSRQEQGVVTNIRIQQLRHDVQTRWHLRLAAMTTFITRCSSIEAVIELGIPKTESYDTLSRSEEYPSRIYYFA